MSVNRIVRVMLVALVGVSCAGVTAQAGDPWKKAYKQQEKEAKAYEKARRKQARAWEKEERRQAREWNRYQHEMGWYRW